MSDLYLQDFLKRACQHLDTVGGPARLPESGDFDFVPAEKRAGLRPAAVLIAIAPRPDGAKVLFTQRPQSMAAHPGQVAFPGGKIEAQDKNAVAAALREAEEEVGIDPQQVTVIARGADYITGSNFHITPILGLLPGDFQARPDPGEVADVFEVPLDYLFDQANHQFASTLWQGQPRRYMQIHWGSFRIWGVTAGIIHDVHKAIYASELEPSARALVEV